mgnify:CR=1 FL=1
MTAADEQRARDRAEAANAQKRRDHDREMRRLERDLGVDVAEEDAAHDHDQRNLRRYGD